MFLNLNITNELPDSKYIMKFNPSIQIIKNYDNINFDILVTYRRFFRNFHKSFLLENKEDDDIYKNINHPWDNYPNGYNYQ